MARALLSCLIMFVCLCFSASAHVPEAPVPYSVVYQKPPPRCGDIAVGCAVTDWNDPPILYINTNSQKTLWHEKGHIYDWYELKDRNRSDFRDIFSKLEDRKWSGLPSEWFAEGYARCALHIAADHETSYGYDPTPRQHLLVCKLIWSTV